MASPRVSVLIPTYNYARFLPEAIESVLAQDFQEFELLISDDCSTDASAEVVARYAAKDSRIRYQRQPANLGMVQNWNWCLSEARGEYIKFLFGDDKFATGHALRTLVQLLEDNPAVTLAASARYVIGETSAILHIWDEFVHPGLHQGSDVIARCLDADCNLIGEPSVVLFRRRDAARGFNTHYRQIVDQEMWFHLLGKGDFVYVSEPLCCFRRHPRQQTEANKLDRVGDLEGYRLFAEYHGKPGLDAGNARKRLFARVYDLRKNCKRNPHVLDQFREVERDLSADLGGFWYAAYWLRRKITKPFQNLDRWFRRRGKKRRLQSAPPPALRQTERELLRDRAGR